MTNEALGTEPLSHTDRFMRYFAAFALLFPAACISDVTATAPDTKATAYTLNSVDLHSLPTEPDNSPRWVLSGSLTLQPDGYYVLSEGDSVWTGGAFAREDWTEGGRWTADGSLLTLSDTAGEPIDPYGAGTSTYLGSIAADGVLLKISTDDGTETHVYRYTRP